jgi:hypothetical protein
MMEIRAGFDIAFDIPRPTPMILMLTIHPSRLGDLLTDYRIAFTPPTISHDYKDIAAVPADSSVGGDRCIAVAAANRATDAKAEIIRRLMGRTLPFSSDA